MAEPPVDAGEGSGEEEFEDGEFPFLKADHPLLNRVQDALAQQLTRHNERVSLQLREKNEELKKLVKHREEIGVTLYGAQQQLAKLQLQLEQLHDKMAMVESKRLEDDDALKQVTAAYEAKKAEVDEAVRRLGKSQDEQNQLNITLRQVEEYNEQMKAEIQVTRRATYKAEDHIKTVEKAKVKQDLVIDTMNEEVKRMTEQKALLEAQLVAQKQETEAAVTTLREATREMEAIEFEKKQLLQQWRSSLVGMQRRDEALQNVQQALQEQAEMELSVESEIRGLGNNIRAEQERNEQLTSLRDRNDREMTHLNSAMTQIKTDRERLMEQFNVLKRSMDQCTEETAKHNMALADHEHQHQVVEKNVQQVSRDITALVTKIDDEISEQTTVDRAAGNSKKRIKRIREEIVQKEVETQNLHNEIARVTVDSLNTKAHNQMLKDRLKQLSEDLSEREKLIEQYEQEIRKRHHQIEKKQLYVDRLNREYDEKRTKLENEVGEADVQGPQEAKIKHMKKAIADITKECSDMQKDWIQKQTALLSVSAETDRLRGHLNDQKNRKMVLEQKRVRIEGQLEAHQKEIKELENAMKHLRFDMDRMNGQIVKSDTRSKELSNKNSMMETEFVAKLKEIESQCLAMEAQVGQVKEEKAAITQDILEAERQVLLWERKISLEKEMQEALDPNVGQQESSAMTKEIHRMELRLDQLKRKQESMIMEMERAIHKRDAIALKYEPMAKKSKQVTSAANLKRQVQSLKNNLRLCTQATSDTEEKIRVMNAELEQLTSTIDAANEGCKQFEQELEVVRGDVQVDNVKRQRLLSQAHKLKTTAKRYDDFSMGGPPPPPNVRAQFSEQLAIKQNMKNVLQVLSDAYPQLETLWFQFYTWLGVEPGA